MNYELALELKQAGLTFEYPETRENTYSYLDSSGNPCGATGKDAVYVPTLSELIEACGDRLKSIDQCFLNGTYWLACSSIKDGEDLINEEGPTPDVAVAKLWLALQK